MLQALTRPALLAMAEQARALRQAASRGPWWPMNWRNS
jgi:hypothetical protein